MKIETTTFLCDTPKCRESHTVYEGTDYQVAAHLALAEAGWRIERSHVSGWNHFCTTHRDKPETAS